MSALKFDKLEFGRMAEGKARVILEGDLAAILETLALTGNSLGTAIPSTHGRHVRFGEGDNRRPLIACPMEVGDHE